MQIQFHHTESAADIIEQAVAILAYQETLLADYRGEGIRRDGKDALGAVVFSQVLQAMLQAAKDRIAPRGALKAVTEA